jgi:hypothetical protein
MKQFGRKPARRDPRVPTLSKYTRRLSLAPPAPAADYYSKVASWGMALNDTLGDCTIASIAHCIEQWSAYSGSAAAAPTDADVLAAYEAWCGYSPRDPSSDQGGDEVTVLTAWMTGGFGAGDRLTSFCTLNISDLDEIRDAVAWFGNAYLGINCPQSAVADTSVWDVVPGSPIAGGHAVPIVGYDAKYFYVVSWGMLIPATPAFIGSYLEEAYALRSADWMAANGDTPSGLDLAQLDADMAALQALAPSS